MYALYNSLCMLQPQMSSSYYNDRVCVYFIIIESCEKQLNKFKKKIFVRSGIRTHAHIRGPEHSHSRDESQELSLLSLAP